MSSELIDLFFVFFNFFVFFVCELVIFDDEVEVVKDYLFDFVT